MPVFAEDLPSIVVTQILRHLDWPEKLNAVQAISPWKPHLHTSAAWPSVKYCREAEENEYFVKEKRTNFLICMKVYGKFMREIDISFGYKTGRKGLQILHAIAENCSNLQKFHITPQEAINQQLFRENVWKKSCNVAFCAILQNCNKLVDVGLHAPFIDWCDHVDNNLIQMVWTSNLAAKITDLELVSNSLVEHEGYLRMLEQFTGLKKLTIRREKIYDDIVLHLVKNNLQEITLYQDEELPLSDAQQLNHRFWDGVLKINPNFKVDLILRYILVIKDSFVPRMPLRSLVLDDLVNIVTKGVMDQIVNNYKSTLESFTYTNSYLENFETGDSRLPAALVSMVTKCGKLHTVQYGFPLSSTSILLLACARKLDKLVIPSVEVSYEFDWPIREDWTAEFVEWLKMSGWNEVSLEQAVSSVLKCDWKLHYESLAFEKDGGYL